MNAGDDNEITICHGDAQPGDEHLLADIVAVDNGILTWLQRRERSKGGRMAMRETSNISTELPPLCVLDRHGVDRYLVKLRAVHGEAGRADIAPELTTATRATARRVEAAAEMVPAS